MCGIADEERTPFAEVLRDTVMHVIGRKPVDLGDLELEVIDRAVADILECQRVGAVGPRVAYRPDQAGASRPGQREDTEKIGLIQIDVQFAVYGRAGGFDVCDVENLPVGSSGKSGAGDLAHGRARAVTAGNVVRHALPALRRRRRGGGR